MSEKLGALRYLGSVRYITVTFLVESKQTNHSRWPFSYNMYNIITNFFHIWKGISLHMFDSWLFFDLRLVDVPINLIGLKRKFRISLIVSLHFIVGIHVL